MKDILVICLLQVSLEQLGLLELLETEAFQDKVDSLVKLVPREIMDRLVLLDCRVLWVMWDFQDYQALLEQQETPELLVHLETKVFLETKEIQEIQVIQVEMPAHRWDPQDLQVPRVHKAQLVLQEVKAALVIVEVQVIQDKQVMLAVLDPQASLALLDQLVHQVTEDQTAQLVQLVLLALQDNQGIEDSLVFQEMLAQLVTRDNQAPLDRTVLKDYQVIVDIKEQQDLRETQVPKDREDCQVGLYILSNFTSVSHKLINIRIIFDCLKSLKQL